MKSLLLTLLLLISSYPTVYADNNLSKTNISLEDATNLVKEQMIQNHPEFENFNIYLMAGNYDAWNIFVDAQPSSNWSHPAFHFVISKGQHIAVGDMTTPLISKTEINELPDCELTALYINKKSKSDSTKTHFIGQFPKSKQAIKKGGKYLSPIADKTYAIILNGGMSPKGNQIRFWNDCSFIYQTLTKTYGIPKENIYVIMSDGTDEGLDMNVGSLEEPSYVSSPLDLDFDTYPDIQYAATRENIYTVISEINNKITEDDHLFFFATDHGAYNRSHHATYLRLWKLSHLFDYELAEWLKPIADKGVNINAVFGQCYSGGFVNALSSMNAVVCSACDEKESSNSSSKLYDNYDEFLYHWTCAVNRSDPEGNHVDADINGDGYITMDEAFIYAKNNDEEMETPQYISTPISTGEDLSFNELPTAVDLYIKDYTHDTGKQYNEYAPFSWNSPSIWNRVYDDDETIHQSFDYHHGPSENTIYVWVHNRGKKTYDTSDLYLHSYWAKAATCYTPDNWHGINSDHYGATGGKIGSTRIASVIASGDSALIKIPWITPKCSEHYYHAFPAKTHSINYLISIGNKEYDLERMLENSYADVILDNNFSEKCTSTMERENVRKSCEIYFRNPYDWARRYTFEFIPVSDKDKDIFTDAKLYLDFREDFYNEIIYNNIHGSDIKKAEYREYALELTKDKNILPEILLRSNCLERVALHAVFTKTPTEERDYNLNLIQKDETGEIIGGHTFLLEAPKSTTVRPPVYIEDNGDGSYIIGVQSNQSKAVNWLDSDTNVISEEEQIVVIPNKDSHSFKVNVLTENGDMQTENVELIPSFTIETITTNASENNIDISLSNAIGARNAAIVVSGITSPTSNITTPVSQNGTGISISTNTLPDGVYNISSIVDGKVYDSINYIITH